MRPPEDALAKGLRELAAASPQGAPPELGGRLRNAFARHHARRRQKRVALVASVALVALISFTWLLVGKNTDTTAQTNKLGSAEAPALAQTSKTGSSGAPRASAAPRTRKHPRTAAKTGKPAKMARTESVANNDFVALPSFDPAIPVGPSRIVRLEMPGAALQLVGFPVNEELLERRVLTDVLVGQDGVPYAVRLVRSQARH
jgi:hypothetical protein